MTQVERLLESVKRAMISGTPVVYIPTPDIELVQELLYGPGCVDALVPRIKAANKSRLLPDEIFETDAAKGEYKSIADNYKVNGIPDSIRVPSLLVSYAPDLNAAASSARSFITLYLGVKKSENQTRPEIADAVRRSLYIIVTPREDPVPPALAPYVLTVRVPAADDAEIEDTVRSTLGAEGIPARVPDPALMALMTVSLRGFSILKIRRLLRQMTAEGHIGPEGASPEAVMGVIRGAKRQLLNNARGLRWERASASGVAGLDSISRWLRQRRAIFRDTELARRQHMDIPGGVLVTGIPGSGKSLMAKTAATILNMPLISLDMGALLGGLMGESEHNMIDALRMAEQMAPCVLWIDEIEKAFSGSSQASSSSDGGVGRRMFGKFLTWMQEKTAACFVFATSNDISVLPPELFRSERFDRKFFTFMPCAADCAAIFAANIAGQNRAYDAELRQMAAAVRKSQPRRLFDPALEEPSFWLEILDSCVAPDPEACVLHDLDAGKTDADGQPAEPRYGWATPARPRHKLLTGADISALVKEAKFRICPEPKLTPVDAVYTAREMDAAVRAILRGGEFKPYGETNLRDIVRCFLRLHENEFVPAAGSCPLDFDLYDADERLYRHDPARSLSARIYDRVLYYTLVGAVNHYARRNQ